MALIKFKGVSKRFGFNTILEDLNFEIQKDSIVAIVGRNGIGKTTVLNLIAGIIKPNKGKIVLRELDSNKYFNQLRIKNIIGYAPQNPIRHNIKVKEFLRSMELFYEEDSNKIIDFFGLENILEERINKLSYGYQKLLSVVQAFMGKEIILLDEPFVNLDINFKTKIREFIKKTKRTFVITSHLFEEIKLITDQIILISDKTIKFSGSISELSKKNLVRLRVGSYSKAFINDLKRFAQIKDISNDIIDLIVDKRDYEKVIKLLAKHRIKLYYFDKDIEIEEFID